MTADTNDVLAADCEQVGLPAPIVVTGPATVSHDLKSATLTGTINPNGAATKYRFQWGKTTAYCSMTPIGTLPAGTTTVPVSVKISVSKNTTYHYRLVATNANGTTYGADMSFTVPKK